MDVVGPGRVHPRRGPGPAGEPGRAGRLVPDPERGHVEVQGPADRRQQVGRRLVEPDAVAQDAHDGVLGLQPPLLPLPLRHVGLDGQEVGDPAVGAVDGLDLHRRPVFPAALGVVEDLGADRLPGPDPLAHEGADGGVGLRPLEQRPGVVADRLAGLVAGDPGEALVDPLDPAAGVGDDHRLLGPAGEELEPAGVAADGLARRADRVRGRPAAAGPRREPDQGQGRPGRRARLAQGQGQPRRAELRQPQGRGRRPGRHQGRQRGQAPERRRLGRAGRDPDPGAAPLAREGRRAGQPGQAGRGLQRPRRRLGPGQRRILSRRFMADTPVKDVFKPGSTTSWIEGAARPRRGGRRTWYTPSRRPISTDSFRARGRPGPVGGPRECG